MWCPKCMAMHVALSLNYDALRKIQLKRMCYFKEKVTSSFWLELFDATNEFSLSYLLSALEIAVVATLSSFFG